MKLENLNRIKPLSEQGDDWDESNLKVPNLERSSGKKAQTPEEKAAEAKRKAAEREIKMKHMAALQRPPSEAQLEQSEEAARAARSEGDPFLSRRSSTTAPIGLSGNPPEVDRRKESSDRRKSVSNDRRRTSAQRRK